MGQVQRLAAVGGYQDIVVCLAEIVCQQLGHGWLVVYHQDSLGHTGLMLIIIVEDCGRTMSQPRYIRIIPR